jgi:hypothetical protein
MIDTARCVANTAAFMVMGLPTQNGLTKLLQHWGKGCIELVDELTQFAPISQRLLEAKDPQDFPGVYDYEVSEEFGAWFAKFILANKDAKAPSLDEGTAKLKELIDGFFKQGQAKS